MKRILWVCDNRDEDRARECSGVSRALQLEKLVLGPLGGNAHAHVCAHACAHEHF